MIVKCDTSPSFERRKSKMTLFRSWPAEGSATALTPPVCWRNCQPDKMKSSNNKKTNAQMNDKLDSNCTWLLTGLYLRPCLLRMASIWKWLKLETPMALTKPASTSSSIAWRKKQPNRQRKSKRGPSKSRLHIKLTQKQIKA